MFKTSLVRLETIHIAVILPRPLWQICQGGKFFKVPPNGIENSSQPFLDTLNEMATAKMFSRSLEKKIYDPKLIIINAPKYSMMLSTN